MRDPADLEIQAAEQVALMEEGDAMAPERASGMSDDDLLALVAQEIRDSDDVTSGRIGEERERAISYYYGRPFGNEVEGHSSVVLSDVSETIDWVMPSLLRMFTGGKQIARFEPIGPEDEQGARQRSDFINYHFMRRQNGAMILHDAIKTALLEKHAFFHVFIDEQQTPTWETYTGLSDIGIAVLLAQPGVEAVEHEVRQEVFQGPDGQQAAVAAHDVTIKRPQSQRLLRVETFPPEEFVMTRGYARIDDNTPFCGRKRKLTISQLVAAGYDSELVESIPSEGDIDTDLARQERLEDEDLGTPSTFERPGASREVWITECSMLVDYDGDGFAERRSVVVGGTGEGLVLLENERATDVPFATITPYPIPHKFWGRSLADLVTELQLIRSTLLRMMLDHLYLTVNPRWEAVEGEVEIDDLLVSRTGGVVRVRQPGMVRALDRPDLGPTPFQALEYLHTERENRSGSTRYNQGLDASSLNQTATGISSIMEASQARIEMIARIFAESGLKRVFWLMARLFKRGGFQREVVRLRNQWTEVDPSTWTESADVTIEVGIGVGQARERVQNLMQIIGLQEKAAQALGPLIVTPQKVFAAVSALAEAMGFSMDEHFFRDPGEEMPPEPPPPPEMVTAQAKAQEVSMSAEEAKARLNFEMQKSMAELELRREQMLVSAKLEREKIESEERIALAKIQSDERKAEKKAEEAPSPGPVQ